MTVTDDATAIAPQVADEFAESKSSDDVPATVAYPKPIALGASCLDIVTAVLGRSTD